MHLPSLRIHQNLTYEPQAEQELCVCQDTLVPPGVTSAIAHISYGHTCTRVLTSHPSALSHMHLSIQLPVSIHERTFMLHNHEYVTKLRIYIYK